MQKNFEITFDSWEATSSTKITAIFHANMSTPLSLRVDVCCNKVHSCPSIAIKVPPFINLSVHQEIKLCLNVSSLVNKPYLSL